MKSKIILLLYSLSIMFVWGICFLNGGGFTSEISVLLGLGFTMYS